MTRASPFGGSPCLSELSHGCHGGGVGAANPQGQRFGNSVGPCRCGWDSTRPQQEGAFNLSSTGPLCGFSLPSSHRDTRYVTSHALAKHGSPKLMLLHPILGDSPSHPRAIGCLCPFQVLTEAAMSPRLPLVSCLSVRLSLRTERLQEASFLPPPLLASTHAHPTAGCPSVPAASCHQGSDAFFLCPLRASWCCPAILAGCQSSENGQGR